MRKVILTSASGETLTTSRIPNILPRPGIIAWHDLFFVFGGTEADATDVYVQTKPYKFDDGRG